MLIVYTLTPDDYIRIWKEMCVPKCDKDCIVNELDDLLLKRLVKRKSTYTSIFPIQKDQGFAYSMRTDNLPCLEACIQHGSAN